jgi:hypothetical protein
MKNTIKNNKIKYILSMWINTFFKIFIYTLNTIQKIGIQEKEYVFMFFHNDYHFRIHFKLILWPKIKLNVVSSCSKSLT